MLKGLFSSLRLFDTNPKISILRKFNPNPRHTPDEKIHFTFLLLPLLRHIIKSGQKPEQALYTR